MPEVSSRGEASESRPHSHVGLLTQDSKLAPEEKLFASGLLLAFFVPELMVRGTERNRVSARVTTASVSVRVLFTLLFLKFPVPFE